jgi:hypothetical protein
MRIRQFVFWAPEARRLTPLLDSHPSYRQPLHTLLLIPKTLALLQGRLRLPLAVDNDQPVRVMVGVQTTAECSWRCGNLAVHKSGAGHA